MQVMWDKDTMFFFHSGSYVMFMMGRKSLGAVLGIKTMHLSHFLEVLTRCVLEGSCNFRNGL